MPLSLPAGMEAELKKRGAAAPICLLDVQCYDGSLFYWSDLPGSFPVKLGAPGSSVYSPWLKSVGPFRLSRSLATDGGDILLQNITGNSLERDVSKAMTLSEFEGALGYFRLWHPLLQAPIWEFQGFLSEPGTDPSEARLRLLQLLDTSMAEAPDGDYQELCGWRYKSRQCGSAGTAVVCPKDFASCQDVARAAVERFNGLLTPRPDVGAVGFGLGGAIDRRDQLLPGDRRVGYLTT